MTKEKEIEEVKKDIKLRLKKSNKKLWDSLSEEDKHKVVNKYYYLRDIDYLGLDKVLEQNAEKRINLIYMFLGLGLGFFANIFSDIFMKYLPKSTYVDIFFGVLSIVVIFYSIRSINLFSIENLKQNEVLEKLLELSKKEN